MAEHDAICWQPLDDGAVQCGLCNHRCHIVEGQWGYCRVRRNIGGELKTFNFDQIIAANVDPIEKKPLFHVLPGSKSFSIAAPGCNFHCNFCQNWEISQLPREGNWEVGKHIAPETLVATAAENGCASIAYTYTEPTIYMELASETAHLAHPAGIKNVFVTNGFMTAEGQAAMGSYLDAANVDLKAFREETYREVMGGHLDAVCDTLKRLVDADVWVEVTTLIVPGLNDSEDELGNIAEFIATQLGKHVPWHLSRFHGDYHMSRMPPTPVETIERACQLGAAAGLYYVYGGNVAGLVPERTICPACGAVVIDRVGFTVNQSDLTRDGACRHCGRMIEGLWR
jgi:pyruvate formate lyase activating enzyme